MPYQRCPRRCVYNIAFCDRESWEERLFCTPPSFTEILWAWGKIVRLWMSPKIVWAAARDQPNPPPSLCPPHSSSSSGEVEEWLASLHGCASYFKKKMFLLKFTFILCALVFWLYAYLCENVRSWSYRQLSAAKWVLGFESRSSGRAIIVLNC